MRNLLKTLIVGITTGAVLVLLLAYPVYTWLLSAFVAPERAGPQPLLAAGLVALAVLAVGASGRLAAAWTRARGPWERLAVGAASGWLAGFVLYTGFGAVAAGIAGQAPLYDLILARADTSPGESALKFIIAINQTFPITFGVFWLLLGGGALIGGLAAWRRSAPTPSISMPISIPIAISVASAWLVVIVCINTILFGSLGEQTQTAFDDFGFTPRWSPLRILPETKGQPWLVLLVLLCIALRTTLRKAAATDQDQAMAVNQSSLMLVLLLLWTVLHRPTTSALNAAMYAITAILTLELFLARRRLRQSKPAFTLVPAAVSGRAQWMAGGIAGGLLALPLNFQWVSLFISIMTIAVRTVGGPELVKTAPLPLDVAGLERQFFWPLIVLQLVAGLVLLAIHVLGGGLMGLALRRSYMPKRFRRLIPGLTTGALVVATLAGTYSLIRQYPPLSAVLTAALVLVLAHRRGSDSPLRLRQPIVALSFGCAWLGVLGLALRGAFQVSPGPLLTLAFALVVGPATAIAFLALHVYVSRFRLAASLGVVLLAVWIFSSSERAIQVKGGVTRYDGRRWEVFTLENSTLGGRLNYQFFQDEQGQLWFGGGSGAVAGRVDGRWQSYHVLDVFGAYQGDQSDQGARALFVQDRQGRLWIALGDSFGQFDPPADSTVWQQTSHTAL